MTLDKGNRAIAEHAVRGKDILLFETLGRGNVRFCGPFNCAGYAYVKATDAAGAMRKAIVFELGPIIDGADISADSDIGATPLIAPAAYPSRLPGVMQSPWDHSFKSLRLEKIPAQSVAHWLRGEDSTRLSCSSLPLLSAMLA